MSAPSDNRSPLTADELAKLVLKALREEASDQWDRALHNLTPENDQIGNALDNLADKIERLLRK